MSINPFLKSNREKSDLRGVYLRITVDGVGKETSLSYKWDIKRWNQKAGRANGPKEDAKTLNYILDTIISKITNYKVELLSNK
ncbi:Arm DNA-binding domain-containing protein [Myroides sp. LJL115]